MAGLTPPSTGSETLNEYLRQLQAVVDGLDLRKIPEEGWSLTDLKADVSEVISDKRDIIDVANEAARKLAEIQALASSLGGYDQSLEEARAFKAAAESLIDWYDQNEVAVQALQEMVSKEGGAAELIEAFDAIRIETNNSATAAKASETAAASSKTAAASSATAANTSKNAAATSATNAKTSETNAANSATAAAGSATAAATSETNAKASETAAASSKTAAASSATAANTSKNAAATSATNAKTSETNAANSATAAAGSATAAANSAASITDGAATATSKAAEASASADRAEAATEGKADIGHKHTKADITDLPTVTTSATGSAIVQRSSSGHISVPSVPSAATDASSKEYVDYQALTKADAVHTHTSAQISDATFNATGNTVIKRDANGMFNVATPTASAQPTTKKYVDDQVATKANASHTHTSAQISDATSNATANMVVKRDANGRFNVTAPTASAHPAPKSYVDQRPALFSGAGDPPSTIAGAVVGDYWLNETTMQLRKITGV